MAAFSPNLLEAATPDARMDALCQFIEFWLGPRRPDYGESTRTLSEHSLPMPLKRLYEFAGRWPNWDHQGPIQYAVPAFAHQDSLAALDTLKHESDGKVVFLHENQGVWNCRTLSHGDDPPVWCYGDQMDEQENWFTGERLVCDSLSRFLVTFVLQEITSGARLHLSDEGLTARFESQQSSVVPIWLDGPYVYDSRYNYFLWGDVLVANLWGDFFFAANTPAGIAFLTENQGSVNRIGLMMGQQWSLDIRSDGSAHIRHLRGQSDESAETPPGAFDFLDLLATLSAAGSNEGHYEENAVVYFFRKGQSGGVSGKYLHDNELVKSLFQLALQRSLPPKKTLADRFASEWPL